MESVPAVGKTTYSIRVVFCDCYAVYDVEQEGRATTTSYSKFSQSDDLALSMVGSEVGGRRCGCASVHFFLSRENNYTVELATTCTWKIFMDVIHSNGHGPSRLPYR